MTIKVSGWLLTERTGAGIPCRQADNTKEFGFIRRNDDGSVDFAGRCATVPAHIVEWLLGSNEEAKADA